MSNFKDFINEYETSPVNGFSELDRLSKSHRLFVLQTNYKTGAAFMKGNIFANDFARSRPLVEFSTLAKRINPIQDTFLVFSFPTRWDKRLGRPNDPKDFFTKMIDETNGIKNYVWGMYTLWNTRTESHDSGHFYRNPSYHANDIMMDKWLEIHPKPIYQKPPIPLDQAARDSGEGLIRPVKFSGGYFGS